MTANRALQLVPGMRDYGYALVGDSLRLMEDHCRRCGSGALANPDVADVFWRCDDCEAPWYRRQGVEHHLNETGLARAIRLADASNA